MGNLKVRLVGAWRMTDWRLNDGEREDAFVPPLGYPQDCGGLLIYSDSGAMSATLSQLSRQAFRDQSFDGGTNEERAAAFSSIVAYSGTYKINEETSEVVHVVEYATLPHFVGQHMLRTCTFEGNRMKLHASAIVIGGRQRTSYIEWKKIEVGAPQGLKTEVTK